ncbi:DUF2442 domain-containing protein [Acetobacter fallax]|uniref:DUF2442 domain-containing protein n=1 Tax=Acetobacter fallax TaxID=1737473 RepID=UPI001F54ACB5|nr:DUF2442 domain-containing protein [Acetobacter fallax]
MSLPADLLQDLQGTSLNDLAEIEITPLGNGLHWPRFDADIVVEGLWSTVSESRWQYRRDAQAGHPPARQRRQQLVGMGLKAVGQKA